MNGIIIKGVFYEQVNDDFSDCPDSCDLINICNERKGAAPCLFFYEKCHFEKRKTNIQINVIKE